MWPDRHGEMWLPTLVFSVQLLTCPPAINSGQASEEPLVYKTGSETSFNLHSDRFAAEYNVEIQVFSQDLRRSVSDPATATSKKPGPPIISHTQTLNAVAFHWDRAPEDQSDLEFSFRGKTSHKACWGSRMSSWAGWSSWPSPQRSVNMEKFPYSIMSLEVKARSSAGVEGEVAKDSVNVSLSIPYVKILSLTCPPPYPTSCSVTVENDCTKEHGPDLSIEFDIEELDAGQTWTLRERVTSSRATLSLPFNLRPSTRHRITAYPANTEGRNSTDPGLTKEAVFTSKPATASTTRPAETNTTTISPGGEAEEGQQWIVKVYQVIFAIMGLIFLSLICFMVRRKIRQVKSEQLPQPGYQGKIMVMSQIIRSQSGTKPPLLPSDDSITTTVNQNLSYPHPASAINTHNQMNESEESECVSTNLYCNVGFIQSSKLYETPSAVYQNHSEFHPAHSASTHESEESERIGAGLYGNVSFIQSSKLHETPDQLQDQAEHIYDEWTGADQHQECASENFRPEQEVNADENIYDEWNPRNYDNYKPKVTEDGYLVPVTHTTT